MQDFVIKAVIDAGFKVYMRKREDSWMIYTDGDKIAYLQADRLGYCSISTINHPHKFIGSGFKLDDPKDLSREELSKAFVLAPSWALGRDLPFVKKYKGIDAYKAASKFNAEYEEITQ